MPMSTKEIRRAERQQGTTTWIVGETDRQVPLFKCKVGESVGALAQKLGLRALSRIDQRDQELRKVVVAIIRDDSGEFIYPCIEAS